LSALNRKSAGQPPQHQHGEIVRRLRTALERTHRGNHGLDYRSWLLAGGLRKGRA
jgi:hypothetical protein